MKNVEFYNTPESKVLFRDDKGMKELEPEDRAPIDFINGKIKSRYAEADKALDEIYRRALPNIRYRDYLKAHRFARCNFGVFDSTDDIDSEGNFVLEEVPCPLRGECKWEGIVCKPKVTTTLTKREYEIMNLVHRGFKVSEIADKLFISIFTVKQHKRNALSKFELHSTTDFILYANKNNLFK